jgi:uncharacterized membrane protein
MKPEEKALKLYHKFFQEIPGHPVFDDRLIAKQCALIAVDETLWVLNELDHDLPDDDAILFYSEVKQEIEKL